jgi:hypothetical protein
MQSIIVFALFGLFAVALLAGGLVGLCLLMRRPARDPYAEPFGDIPGRRQ